MLQEKLLQQGWGMKWHYMCIFSILKPLIFIHNNNNTSWYPYRVEMKKEPLHNPMGYMNNELFSNF